MGLSSSTPRTEERVFDQPWRPVNWSDREQMLQKLKEIQSPRGLDHLRILVVGPVGSGKSSFITSANTTLQGRNTCLAHSLNANFTTKYNTYKLNKGTDGSFFPFVFGDTMGLEENSSGAPTDDIIKILQGHVHEGFTFNTSEELTAESNDYNETPTLNDKVHCLVFVLAADKVFSTSEGVFDKMKLILQQARKLGIPQAVIMSKVDMACPLVKDDLNMIYKSKKIKEKMEECKIKLDVPLNYIFPVKNYHEEISNSAEVDILILTAVMNIVDFANDFVERNM